ncbi:hypothetical protein SMC26_08425 [Actinomadura fulvescens]|uniref:Uncharacterized protein n=1 Tax=Actinomadura fulvescens TaxID=46160 RepID=A0ABN3QUW3_9ACTN
MEGLDAVRRAGVLVAVALERSAAGLTPSSLALAEISATAQQYLLPAQPS